MNLNSFKVSIPIIFSRSHIPVITSYSIHYTKLYDPPRRPPPGRNRARASRRRGNGSLPRHTLTVNSDNGTVTKDPDQASYYLNDVVQLTATPDTGYHFVNWSDDITSTDNPVSVTITGNISITANFAQDEHTLSVVSDNGIVTKNPDQATYHLNDVVQLTADPDAGYHFVNWSGNVTSTDNPVNVTITGDMSVTANYALDEYTLSVVSDNGTVTKNPDSYNFV